MQLVWCWRLDTFTSIYHRAKWSPVILFLVKREVVWKLSIHNGTLYSMWNIRVVSISISDYTTNLVREKYIQHCIYPFNSGLLSRITTWNSGQPWSQVHLWSVFSTRSSIIKAAIRVLQLTKERSNLLLGLQVLSFIHDLSNSPTRAYICPKTSLFIR